LRFEPHRQRQEDRRQAFVDGHVLRHGDVPMGRANLQTTVASIMMKAASRLSRLRKASGVFGHCND
jgi:hypothetical protein